MMEYGSTAVDLGFSIGQARDVKRDAMERKDRTEKGFRTGACVESAKILLVEKVDKIPPCQKELVWSVVDGEVDKQDERVVALAKHFGVRVGALLEAVQSLAELEVMRMK
jgi:hypothetical protein